jgi:TRAP-type uncharacterized transport system fused permease subunit
MVYNPSLSLVTGFTFTGLAWVCLRLALAIWLFSTGFTGYAAVRIGPVQRAARLALGFAVLVPTLWIEAAATLAALAFVAADHAGRDRTDPDTSPKQQRRTNP